MNRLIGIVALMATLLFSHSAEAKFLRYTMAANETLESIAERAYGDQAMAMYLIAYNKIDNPLLIGEGRKLRLPTTATYRVRKGDSYSKIAKRRLGEYVYAESIAWANDRSSKVPLEVGEKIVIPFLVSHRAQKGDSLQKLAALYGHPPKHFAMLGKINQSKEAASKPFSKSRWIIFPGKLRAQDPGAALAPEQIDIAAKPDPLELNQGQEQGTIKILARTGAYQGSRSIGQFISRGQYSRALAELTKIDRRQLSSPLQQALYYWQMVEIYAAKGEPNKALKACEHFARSDPQASQRLKALRSAYNSPKLRYIGRRCRKAAQAAKK